jgi:hypothetical protein
LTHSFSTEQEAAKAMLIEVGSLLNKYTIDYAVLGGWIPYLFNSSPLQHPGTFDVDIVLNASLSKEMVVCALDEMVKNSGYMRAPKNAFQIYRILNVNGENMVFHVDFLHRKYADDTDDLTRSWGRYQSIATVGTDVIFTEKETRSEYISGIGTSGSQESANITFASEAGFLCSKGRSVATGKRDRDGFDIYLVITQSTDIAKLKGRCKALLKDPIFTFSMMRIRDLFTPNKQAVNKAAHFLSKVSTEFRDQEILAAEEISNRVCAFINEVLI